MFDLSDASFANAVGVNSEKICDSFGWRKVCKYYLLLTNAELLVLKAVMSVDMHPVLPTFENGYIIREWFLELSGRHVELEASVTSHTLFNVIERKRNTAEPRLQIHAFPLTENYKNGELERTGFISVAGELFW